MFTLEGLLFIFALGSITGWFIEMPARLIIHRKLINPGFLNGPYVPIYGFAFVFLSFLSFFEMNIFLRVLFFAASTTILELITGLIFTNIFKVRLWEYSNHRFNYKGIICPLFSFFWVICSLGFFFFIFPLIKIVLNLIQGNFFVYFGLGIFYGIFIIDCFKSFSLIAKIRHIVIEINERRKTGMLVDYRSLKVNISNYLKKVKHTNFLKRFFFTINNAILVELPKQVKKVLEKK